MDNHIPPGTIIWVELIRGVTSVLKWAMWPIASIIVALWGIR